MPEELISQHYQTGKPLSPLINSQRALKNSVMEAGVVYEVFGECRVR